MPTHEEWTELRENCAWKFTNDYNGTGIAGAIVTGFNGNTIFLPAAGGNNADEFDMEGEAICIYWSSSLQDESPRKSWCVLINSYGIGLFPNYRFYNFSVRPVLFGE